MIMNTMQSTLIRMITTATRTIMVTMTTLMLGGGLKYKRRRLMENFELSRLQMIGMHGLAILP